MRRHACGTHAVYRLTCQDYDALIARHKGACWRCNRATDRPHVDHDHALGMTAVRGMLCPPCNTRLGRVDGGAEADALDRAYLAEPWHAGKALDYVPDNRTTVRNLRVDCGLWAEVKRIASARRETVSAIIKRALVEYVERHGGDTSR